jgi:CRISPR-associated protein (TIGR03986 family)
MAKNIYVGNLPYTTIKDDDLRELFSKHGNVISAKVIKDRETGGSKGFGFVEMDTGDADRAITALNGTQFNGRPLRVNEAQPRPKGQNHGARGGHGAPAVNRGGNPGQHTGGNPGPNPAQRANAGAGGGQNNTFHNPYHFVPTSKPDESKCLPKKEFLEKACLPHSHAVYKGLSGRLVCKLTTVEPVFIGAHVLNEADDNAEIPKKLANFELDGKPAIPATSLRGLLSSIAEAASGSALRVLEDKTLSYRKTRKKSLSALGVIVEEEGKLKLRPLSTPTLTKKGDSWVFPDDDGKYDKMFPGLTYKRTASGVLPMKVYVGDYTHPDDEKTKFIINNESFNHKKEYYYLKLNNGWNYQNGMLASNNQKLHRSGNDNYVAAQDALDNSAPITEEKYKELEGGNDPNCGQYTRGILRILGKDPNYRVDIPDNKKHELFIPYPDNMEKAKAYPIEGVAIDRYHKLAEERAADTEKEAKAGKKSSYARRPYLPKGTRDNDDQKFWKLKDGDVVYFKPDKEGIRVAEISFSSIWRDRVESEIKVTDANGNPRTKLEASTVHKFFNKISKELLPFNKGSEWITPAELLFGFVQAGEKKKEGVDDDRLALAGKVRVSFGITSEDKYYYKTKENGFGEDGYVPLKILATPKPPCPAMYFKKKNGATEYISKSALNINDDEPQGRKMYLHKKEGDNGEVNGKSGPWETKDPKDKNYKQKALIRPIKKGVTFYFHIDFDNLNEWELGLLCYAVKPSESFHHKIGMGKPLG